MINVIIPAYNCAKTLGRTLSSLAAQTDTNFELIIVDDCSIEDIKSIVDKFSDCLKIKYIRNETNIGCGMSRQVGIDNATCKYITFLDSDDMFFPYTIETFNELIESNPNLEYLHTYFYEQVVKGNEHKMFLHKDNWTCCHGKLYNVELIRKYGIKNSPDVKWADDSYFNSMCGEFMQLQVFGIPTMLWSCNKNSVIRRKDDVRDENIKKDFLNAMLMSAKFCYEKKGSVDFALRTYEHIKRDFKLDEEETEKLSELLKYITK